MIDERSNRIDERTIGTRGKAVILSPMRTHWFFRYKLYHLPFWAVYHYVWWSVTVGNPQAAAGAMFTSVYGVKTLFYIVVQAAGVYFNLYFLMPHLLDRGSYAGYILAVVVTILLTALLILPGYYLTAYLAHQSFRDLYGAGARDGWYFFKLNTLPSSAASMTLAMTIKLTKKWIETRNEKIETELKLLKYQFNPHFLFNTINSIFFLIHKNPDRASDALARFSDLLRHQLYESNSDTIALSTEITYLENFIALERLRQNPHVRIMTDIPPHDTAHLEIAPFVLMTFIENAFKHVGRGPDGTSWIDIRLRVHDHTIQFSVSNSVREIPVPRINSASGLGLPGVRRRLVLVYPGTHDLTIHAEPGRFSVNLELEQLKTARCSAILS